ncbi:MAG: NAD(P)-dependent oxidoreductase [Polyangiaceae bacterium]
MTKPKLPPRVAVLGLGAMGQRMARRLLAQPVDLHVFNRTATRAADLGAAGAAVFATPREAVAGVDLALSMVRDDEASGEVWLGEQGALAALRNGAIAIECSTVTPGQARRLGEAAEGRGLAFLDAPVVGSTPQAEAGTLAFLVGGEATVKEAASPTLAALGATILHAGPVGAGATSKLLVNALFAGQVALMAELLQAGEAQGLPPHALLELLRGLPVSSPAALGAGALMVAGDDAARFPLDLALKDLDYAIALGAMPTTRAVRTRFEAAAAAGHGAANLTAIRRL